jgi:hypothetical protein
MRYITRATLVARLRSNSSTNIFIPPGEVVDTESDPDNPAGVRLYWRGQSLRTDDREIADSTEAAEAVTSN